MPLIVGSRSYDLSTRALVVGVLDVEGAATDELCRRAERLTAEGADLIELRGTDVGAARAAVQALGGSVALAAGAPLLAIAAETGVAFIAGGVEEARTAAQRGVQRDRIVVDVTPRLCPSQDELGFGYPLLASICSPGAADGADDEDVRARALAATALAISTGCRLVRTHDLHGLHGLHGVRRVRDVMAAVLEAAAVAAGARP